LIVELDGITKRFPARRSWLQTVRAPFSAPRVMVVDRVSFGVGEGEIFGLLGQNGAGKTTIFKMLATLIIADEGRARVGGHDVRDQGPAVRRLLAPVLANERSLYWRTSARENVRLYAALQGLDGAAAREEVARVLAITGLSDVGGKMVGEFSSGMKQRLLIARSLLGRPRVLLLDEPTRSLDPISARDFRRFLRERIVDAEGCTVLLATHDADEVWELCDRVGVLERGRLLAVDRTAVLRHQAGTDGIRLWLREGAVEQALALATRAGFVLARRGPAVEAGWEEVECPLRGEAEVSARLVSALVQGGVEVARCERRSPSLADLIERVLALSAAGRADA